LDAQLDKDKINYNIAKLSKDSERFSWEKFQTILTQDPVIKGLEKQRQEEAPTPGSPEWRWFDEAINKRTMALARQEGYEDKIVPYESPGSVPKPAKKKGLFGGSDKKEDSKKEDKKYDQGIPPGLPEGTKYLRRTPDGKPIYLLPSGKEVIPK
jgi:hypothetical protein